MLLPWNTNPAGLFACMSISSQMYYSVTRWVQVPVMCFTICNVFFVSDPRRSRTTGSFSPEFCCRVEQPHRKSILDTVQNMRKA